VTWPFTAADANEDTPDLYCNADSIPVSPGRNTGYKAADDEIGAADGVAPLLVFIEFLSIEYGAEQLLKSQTGSSAPAGHDPLTGLATSQHFSESLAAAVSQAAQQGHCHALLLLDLNGLANINDVFGHAASDGIVMQVAARVRDAVGPATLVARTAEGEFSLLTLNLPCPEGVANHVRRLLLVFDKSIQAEEEEHFIGAAVGVALYPQDAPDAAALNRRAGIARYRAKAERKTNACFFEEHMERLVQERRRLRREIRRALSADHIVPHYQPIVDLQTGNIVEFEALARWQHPELGVVAPSQFIPVAEETALIRDVTETILGSACRNAVQWPEHIGLSVNLSPILLEDGSIAARILSIVAGTGLAPHRLTLEVTESRMVENLEVARRALSSLRQANIRIALDDFGTAASSFYHLKNLQFDKLKIDSGYVKALGSDPKNDAIVDAIFGLGQSLGITVTAEGVETVEQRMALIARHCKEGQGFLFGRPMAASEAESLLTHRQGETPQHKGQ
jgi:diguanylate cyclase (GGDEF)-like protein